ncbi:MAG: decarboxylating NADP(+)-dependent phosphogluconate dehydrogenase [Thermodesulfobacteriota bacterium]
MMDLKVEPADVGLIGLAVMGENLALNLESKGHRVAVFNRTTDKTEALVQGRGRNKNFIAAYTLMELAGFLDRPRRVILMVKAGQAVDFLIERLVSLLEPGDVIIDGGNSHFLDTNRRHAWVESRGLLFVGAGISGGEEGALKGPSIMPGGSAAAWQSVKPLLRSIAARAEDGSPCCQWIGPQGSGHFVKMIHNGIEYADMQLIAETYHLMSNLLGLSPETMRNTFRRWNEGPLKSYLIEITADILGHHDQTGRLVLDQILDASGQKGTGKWMVNSALDAGQPLSMISEAVFARFLSARKDLRIEGAQRLAGPGVTPLEDQAAWIKHLEQALFAAKVIAYAQGFSLLRAAAAEFGWPLNYREIALIWRAGCIIRSVLLERIAQAYGRNSDLSHLLFDPWFQEQIGLAQDSLRKVTSAAVINGLAVPGLGAALSYYDGLRTERMPHNLIQAQRDYFGAHQYERMDQPRGVFFHTDWLGDRK